MAMSDKQFKRWRTRLQHAHRTWEERGLIGTSHDSTMRMLIDYYRGEHWQGKMEMAVEHQHTVNKIYSTTNASLAQLSARNPEVQFFGRKEEAMASAPLAEALIQYDIEEMNGKRQWNAALRDHHAAPLGIVRHGFTPSEEYFDDDGKRLELYRPARPDRPWFKRVPIWDCLLDPLSESFHNDGGTGWVAFRSRKTLDEIKRTRGMTVPSGLAPNVANPLSRMRPKHMRDLQNEDWNDLVEYWTVYEIRERTWFQMTLDDGVSKPLREPDDWPIQWEHLPVDLLGIHEQMDTPFPKPLNEELLPIQDELNYLRSIMSVIARNTRRIIGYNDSAIDEAEIEKMLDGEIIEFFAMKGSASEAIQQIAAGGFPQELLSYLAIIETDLREVKGQSLMDRAQRINVNSATEAHNVQRGSDILGSAEQVAFEDFMSSTVRNYTQGRRQTMLEDEMVPILGLPQAQQLAGAGFLSVSPDDLRHDFDYRVVAGSSAPPDHDREAARALADVEAAIQVPEINNIEEAYRRLWMARRLDPSRMLKSQQQQESEQEAAAREAQRSPETENTGVDPAAFNLLAGGGGGA